MQAQTVESTEQDDGDVETELVKPTQGDGDEEYNLTSGVKSTSITSTFSSKKVRVVSAAITLGFSLLLLILLLLHDSSPPPPTNEDDKNPVPTCVTSSCASSSAKILADVVMGYPICPCPPGCEGGCTPEERALGWMVHTDNEFYTYDVHEDKVSYDYLKVRFI